MRASVILRAFISTVALCGFLIPVTAEEFRKIDISGVTSDGRSFEIHIRCSAFQAKYSRGVVHFWGGDSPNFRPQSVVTEFSLMISGHRVTIPSEGFRDLGDVRLPNSYERYGDAGETSLDWSGGDAAGSYSVRFFFYDFKLIRREIYSDSDSKKPTEVKHFP